MPSVELWLRVETNRYIPIIQDVPKRGKPWYFLTTVVNLEGTRQSAHGFDPTPIGSKTHYARIVVSEMSEFLFYYDDVSPTTWVYLSSLLMIGLFFKFSRLWSVRNLDLILLSLLAPGLLLVHFGRQLQLPAETIVQAIAESGAETFTNSEQLQTVLDTLTTAAQESAEPFSDGNLDSADPSRVVQADILTTDAKQRGSADPEEIDRIERGRHSERLGFFLLFLSGIGWLTRLLFDATMVRRPLLEPNLSLGGMTFIGSALFVFLMANTIRHPLPDRANPYQVPSMATEEKTPPAGPLPREDGPGYALLKLLSGNSLKAASILCNTAIVVGIAFVGYRHFGNITMGIGAATLYLMLPYTAHVTERFLERSLEHLVPGALLLWAVVGYRKPVAAGIFLGLASGIIYYPLFLLPLWLSFYWRRGLLRFVGSYFAVVTIMVLTLALVSNTWLSDLRQMFGLWTPTMNGLQGMWDVSNGGWDPVFRLPVLAAFVVLSVSLALWPAQKNLGTILSCSAAIMIAAQFWHGYGGGTYMAWYLPLVLLTVFRPNLEDRVALSVLGESWLPRLKPAIPPERAA